MLWTTAGVPLERWFPSRDSACGQLCFTTIRQLLVSIPHHMHSEFWGDHLLRRNQQHSAPRFFRGVGVFTRFFFKNLKMCLYFALRARHTNNTSNCYQYCYTQMWTNTLGTPYECCRYTIKYYYHCCASIDHDICNVGIYIRVMVLPCT